MTGYDCRDHLSNLEWPGQMVSVVWSSSLSSSSTPTLHQYHRSQHHRQREGGGDGGVFGSRSCRWKLLLWCGPMIFRVCCVEISIVVVSLLFQTQSVLCRFTSYFTKRGISSEREWQVSYHDGSCSGANTKFGGQEKEWRCTTHLWISSTSPKNTPRDAQCIHDGSILSRAYQVELGMDGAGSCEDASYGRVELMNGHCELVQFWIVQHSSNVGICFVWCDLFCFSVIDCLREVNRGEKQGKQERIKRE